MASLLALMVLTVPTADGAGSRPNVVVILADDLGFSDLGCYGGEIDTPNLDRLAANGLRYTQFYNTARCWPTRAALLSGYYAQQVRMDPPAARLPSWAGLLPHHLKKAGYRCYHSGKWHIAGAPQVLKDGGFDRSLDVVEYDRNFGPKKRREDDKELGPLLAGSKYYVTTAIVDHAIACLKDHAAAGGEQFFSYVAFTVPHFPLQAPPEDIAKYRDRYRAGWEAVRQRRIQRLKELGIVTAPAADPEPAVRAPGDNAKAKKGLGRDAAKEAFHAVDWESLTSEQREFQVTKLAIHAAMVDRMDQEIGRLLKQLETMDQLENTLIFFLSDNGASAEVLVRGDGHDPDALPGSAGSYLCLGPGGSTVANTPFRRHKMWVHEGGIATPMIVHWPRIGDRGGLRRQPGHVVDLVPTIAGIAGIDLKTFGDPNAPPRPGKSLVPSFERDTPAERELFFHHNNNRALRVGDWKIVADKAGPNAWELYNLAEDRTERNNLAAKLPERVQTMAARWQTLEDEYRKQGYGDLPPEERPGTKKQAKKKAKAKQPDR